MQAHYLNDSVSVNNFANFKPDSNMTAVFTIFHKTSDYGLKYVARAFQTGAQGVFATRHCVLGDSLEEVREKLPEGLFNLGRTFHDDPTIVESWI